MSSGLEKGRSQDSKRCWQETNADGAKRGHADLIHALGRIKHAQELPWEQLEQNQSYGHDHKGNEKSDLESLHQPALVPGSIIVPHDRQRSLVQPENRHKDKGLDPAINAVHRHCGF